MTTDLLETIGSTPVVPLRRIRSPGSGRILVKLEGGNPTGSYKDRVAIAMVRGALSSERIDSDMRLLECTGGSTGTSLAFVCAALDIPLTIISSDAYAESKLRSMAALGAELLVEPSDRGRVTPDLWPRMQARAAALVAAGTHYWLDQFNNPHAPEGYAVMGRELLDQVPERIDAFCGCVGTAGMITGVGRVIRERATATRVVAVEPETSAVLSGGVAGPHGVDGTAAGFVPPLFDRSVVTDVMAVPEAAGREMARSLARDEGIFAGTSTGLNVLAAMQLSKQLGANSTVVTVACDSGFKYLHEGLFVGS